MSDMIERVAKAIRSGLEASGFATVTANGPSGEEGLRQLFEVLAMDALEAMREHSPEQEKRMEVVLGQDTPPTRRWHWVWWEMIDAALEGHPH